MFHISIFSGPHPRQIAGRGLNHGRSKKDDTYEKPIAVTNFEYLNQVNVVKRDRRTIEEIQQVLFAFIAN